MAGKGAVTCGHCGADLGFLVEGEMTVIYDGIRAFGMFLPEGTIDRGTVSGSRPVTIGLDSDGVEVTDRHRQQRHACGTRKAKS